MAWIFALAESQPLVLIGVRDAASRGIADGDRVRVHNDIGSSEMMAKISPAEALRED